MAALWEQVADAEAERLKQAASERPKMRIGKGATKAEVEAFRARARAEAAERRAKANRATGQRLTQRERTFNEILTAKWSDATWMCNANGFLGFFPDGRPKAEQHPADLKIWGIFLKALVQRANRPAKAGDNERETD